MLSESELLERCRAAVGLDEHAFSDEFLRDFIFRPLAVSNADDELPVPQQLLLKVAQLKQQLASAEAALDALPAAAVAEAEQLERDVSELHSRIARAESECSAARKPKGPIGLRVRASDLHEFLSLTPSELGPLVELGITAMREAKAAETTKRARPVSPSSCGVSTDDAVAVGNASRPELSHERLSLRPLLHMRALVKAAAQKLEDGRRVRQSG